MSRPSLDMVITELRGESSRHRLLAAHDTEFIMSDVPASPSVRRALAAACHEGYALGLELALDLLAERSETPTEEGGSC